MKRYIVYTLFFVYLNNVVFGTTGEMFTSAANLGETFSNATKLEESFINATNLEESSDNGTDLEKSSSNATELKVSPWNFFLYGIQNGTDTKLEHEFKVAIKGGKGKGKITGGNKKKITSGHRYTKTTSGNNDWTVLYAIAGVLVLCVIAFACIVIYEKAKEKLFVK